METPSSSRPDPAGLRKAFAEDLAAAWEYSRRRHPDHTPYAFILYGVEDTIRLFPVVLTEESLTHVAQRYLKDGYHDTLDEARSALRWSVADSPLAYELSQRIPHVDALIAPHESALREKGSYAPLANAGIAALKELDAAGLFGIGPGRERIVLAVLTFDTEEDWSTKSATRLNPQAVFKRFKEQTTLQPVGNWLTCSNLSPSHDGRSLYAVIHQRPRSDQPGQKGRSEIVSFDVTESRLTRRWAFTLPACEPYSNHALVCAVDGSFVLAQAAKGSAHYDRALVRLPRGSNIPLAQRDVENAGAVGISPAGDQCVVDAEGKLQFLSPALELVRNREIDFQVFGMHWLPSGHLLIAAGEKLVLLGADTDRNPRILEIPAIRLSVDRAEKLVAVTLSTEEPGRNEEFGIQLLELPALKPLGTIMLSGHQAQSGALSPDGRLIAFEAHDLTMNLGNPKRCFIVVFDVANGREIARRKPHRDLRDLTFLADGRTIAIGMSDYQARFDPIVLWRIPQADCDPSARFLAKPGSDNPSPAAG